MLVASRDEIAACLNLKRPYGVGQRIARDASATLRAAKIGPYPRPLDLGMALSFSFVADQIYGRDPDTLPRCWVDRERRVIHYRDDADMRDRGDNMFLGIGLTIAPDREDAILTAGFLAFPSRVGLVTILNRQPYISQAYAADHCRMRAELVDQSGLWLVVGGRT
jgi:hypothetical protein